MLERTTRGAAAFLSAVFSTAVVASSPGCGSSGSAADTIDPNADGGAGSDSASFVDGGSDTGTGDGFAACASSQTEATLKPVNLVFLYDKSGSMGDEMRKFDCPGGDIDCQFFSLIGPAGSVEQYVCFPNGQGDKVKFTGLTTATFQGGDCTAGTVDSASALICGGATPTPSCTRTLYFDAAAKWIPVGAATTAFFADPKSSGMAASLGFFPKQQNFSTLCQVADYSTPVVAMRALPDGPPFQAAIAAELPRGNTPTEVALKGTIAYAKTVASARPNEITAIVLVSDGEPTLCTTSSTQPISVVKGVAQAAASDAAQPLKTYVIGVGTSLLNLNQIAAGGGTGSATLIDTSNPAKTSADLLAALESIRGKELSCDVPLPSPPDGKQLDINLVNVSSVVGGAEEVLSYNKDCAGGTGWHYDAGNPPTRIQLCDATCSALRAANGKLNIAFGCATKGGVVR